MLGAGDANAWAEHAVVGTVLGLPCPQQWFEAPEFGVWRRRVVRLIDAVVAGEVQHDRFSPSSLRELSPALNRPGAVWRTLLQ